MYLENKRAVLGKISKFSLNFLTITVKFVARIASEGRQESIKLRFREKCADRSSSGEKLAR